MKIPLRYPVMTVLLFWLMNLYAQQSPGFLDENIRYGKLENGFTYYILHNEEPRDRASFYIVQNVGAILEEDDQDGLAHMLEHMAFNGSAHFPGKGIKNFLERNGVEFGSNINAYTDLDETVYNISNVPTDDPVVMDSCIWILYDWSGSIALEGKEIDAERGVIREEWRTRNSASSRMSKELAPITYYESKYAKRDVIGDMNVVEHSDYEAIRRFYHKWYRPDLQAAVIVGDFDVDQMEARVRRILSQIPEPEHPAERKEYTVADNPGILYGLATDKEATTTRFSYEFKHPATPRAAKNPDYLKAEFDQDLISLMMSNRFSETLQKPDAPFLAAQCSYYNELRTLDLFSIDGIARENEVEPAIRAILTMVEQARRFGFTPGELERAKKDYIQYYESYYKMRDEIDNDQLAMEIKDHYLSNEPMLGVEALYALVTEYVPTVTPEHLKPYLSEWMTDDNAVFTITGPQKSGVIYPSGQEVKQLITAVQNSEMDPYVDTAADHGLLDTLPEAGRLVKAKVWKGHEAAHVYELSNGARVVLYPTTFTKGEVLFSGISPGGIARLETSEIPTARYFSNFVDRMGIGNLSESDLQKVLAGKNLELGMDINSYTENFSGKADTDDLEALLQLIYLSFTAPRFDKEAFDVYLERMRPFFENLEQNPQKVFQDSVSTLLSGGNERRPLYNKQLLDKLSFEVYQKIYRERFGHPGDFTFYFVGDFQQDSLLNLIERYIGGISGKSAKEKYVSDGVHPPLHDVTRRFEYPMETPKYSNCIVYHTENYEYTASNNLTMDLAAAVLREGYFETMREQEGGTYGAGVGAQTSKIPNETMSLFISFDSNPDKAERLLEIVENGFLQLRAHGSSADAFNKAKEAMLRSREQDLEENPYILGELELTDLTGIDGLKSANFEDLLNKMTVDDFNKIVAKVLGEKASLVKYEIIMQPQETR